MNPLLPEQKPALNAHASDSLSGASGSDVEKRLLEEILDTTSHIALEQGDLSSAEWDSLRTIARRCCENKQEENTQLSQSVATELVAAMLDEPFASLKQRQFMQAAAAGHIAQALIDDPIAYARLTRFWQRLIASVSHEVPFQ